MSSEQRLASALTGRYHIERKLGQGGMATVYLAGDVRHHRKVALKVLHEDLAASVAGSRFLREIEIAAQLQHPNILPLHDSGEADGLLYFVMPYVEGQSLRERIAREGEFPIAEATRILAELADALDYAHSHGVVHRDIKPENVMLSGRHALVTDFGVAKAVSDATGQQMITMTGLAIGTPLYMAPEQSTADPHVDHRADLYALGVVAYELLTGQPPFTGATQQQVLAAHLTRPPQPISALRTGVPERLEHAVMKCLEKLPADRWQSASELLAQLEPLVTPTSTPGMNRPRRLPLIGLGVGTLALFAAWLLLRPRDRTPSLTIGRTVQVTPEPGLDLYPAISPDGRLVAYAAGNSARMRIFLRPVGGGRTLTLSNDTTALETQPRWSPNGEQILFLSRGGVYVASALGGTARQVITRAANATVTTAAWSPDGKGIAAVRQDSLLVVSPDGSGSRLIATGKEWHSCVWALVGGWIACVAGNAQYVEPGGFFGNLAPSAIVLIHSSDGRIVPVTDSTTFNQSPQWSSDASQLFFVSNRDGPRDIYAVAVSRDGASRAMPTRITTGLGAQSFSFDAAGARLAYSVYRETANTWALPIPQGGPVSIERAVRVTSGSQAIETARVSHDGKWLYYDSDLNGNTDIYRVPLGGGGEPERLTTHPADDFAPAISGDDREIAFHSFRGGTRDIYVQPAVGGEALPVTATAAQECCTTWSPTGNALAYHDFVVGGSLYVVRRDSLGRWGQPIRRGPGGLYNYWSPDGRHIAFASGRTIHGELMAERLLVVSPDSGEAVVAYTSADTTSDPIVGGVEWSRDGKGVYFKSHDALGRASIWYQALIGGRPRLLVRFDDAARPSFRGNFSSDGERFYFSINERQSDIWVAEVTQAPR